MDEKSDLVQVLKNYDIEFSEQVEELLKLNGFFTLRTLATVTEEDVKEMQEDIRKNFSNEGIFFHKPLIERQKILGDFHQKPSEFRIAKGDVRLILMAAEVCQKILDNLKTLMFIQLKGKEIQRKSESIPQKPQCQKKFSRIPFKIPQKIPSIKIRFIIPCSRLRIKIPSSRIRFKIPFSRIRFKIPSS